MVGDTFMSSGCLIAEAVMRQAAEWKDELTARAATRRSLEPSLNRHSNIRVRVHRDREVIAYDGPSGGDAGCRK